MLLKSKQTIINMIVSGILDEIVCISKLSHVARRNR